MKNKKLIYLLIFLCLLATEIVISLFVNDAFIRPYVGDMLVTLLLCCLCLCHHLRLESLKCPALWNVECHSRLWSEVNKLSFINIEE